MPREITIEAIDRRLARIENILAKMSEGKKGESWAKVGFVYELTGWDREKMRRAREQGLIRYKDTDQGRVYDLNSIPLQFIKPKAI